MKRHRRVLIVQPYGIGDLLFLTPVLRALRLIPTVERVDLLLGSRTDVVVRNNPHVDKIFSVDKDLFHQRSLSKNLKAMWNLGKVLRDRQYDLLLDFSCRPEYGFFSQFFLKIPKRVGFDFKGRGFFYTHKLPIRGGFKDRHVTEYVCDLAKLVNIPVEEKHMEFYLTSEDEVAASELLTRLRVPQWSRFAVLSPGGGESWGKDAHFKRWPPQKFAAFFNPIYKGCGLEGIFLLGTSQERGLCEDVHRGLEIPAMNLAGSISLLEACALIKRATLFVGNDGGLVHVARSLDIPIIAFYGPVDPKVYGPFPESPMAITIAKQNLECRPCYKNFRYNSECADRACLQDLSPEEVYHQLEEQNFLLKLESLSEKI